MPGNKCEYITCQKRKANYPNLSLYRFPTQDHDRLQKWIKNSGNARLLDLTLEQLKARYVCELHFNVESFINITKHRLVRTAVPIFYKNVPSTTLPSKPAPPILRLKSPKHVYVNKKKEVLQILLKEENEVSTLEKQDLDYIRKFLDF